MDNLTLLYFHSIFGKDQKNYVKFNGTQKQQQMSIFTTFWWSFLTRKGHGCVTSCKHKTACFTSLILFSHLQTKEKGATFNEALNFHKFRRKYKNLVWNFCSLKGSEQPKDLNNEHFDNVHYSDCYIFSIDHSAKYTKNLYM